MHMYANIIKINIKILFMSPKVIPLTELYVCHSLGNIKQDDF